MEVIKPEDAVDVPVILPLIKITLETVATGKKGGMQLCVGEDSIDISEGPAKATKAFHDFLTSYLLQVAKIQQTLDQRQGLILPAPAAGNSGN